MTSHNASSPAIVIGTATLAFAPSASAQKMGGTNLVVTVPARSARWS
jgi:hypothetical protein